MTYVFTLRPATDSIGLFVLHCTHQCKRSPLTPIPLLFFLSWTEELAKAGTCAHDMTWPDLTYVYSELEQQEF